MKKKITRTLAVALLLKALASPIVATQKNPSENKFFTGEYINGIELRINDALKREFKVGKRFELKDKGHLYVQGTSPDALTISYYKKNYNLETVIDKGVTFNLEVRQDNFTIGGTSKKKVHLQYLDTEGIPLISGTLLCPYAKAEYSKKDKSISAGAVVMISNGTAPYFIYSNHGKPTYSLGVEQHGKKYMVALRGNLSKNENTARLDIRYKF
ncbi:hypothetical protein JW756_04380 [Candidatus Woesearchaeota archaeon]|nr:hypothetical protein [Candidatus Woesearchaeota archaeon]